MKGKKDYSEAGKTEIAGWTDRETGAENRKNIDEKRTAADSRKGEKAAADSMKKEKTAADSKKAERVEKPENMGRKKAAEGSGKGRTIEKKEGIDQPEKSDNEMLGRIWESSQGIQIPDALSPEQVKKRISDRRVRKRKYYKAVAAAACLCLCFGGGSLALKYTNTGADSGQAVNEAYDDSGRDQSGVQHREEAVADQSMPEDNYVSEDQDQAASESTDEDKAEQAPLKKIGKMYTLASGYGDVYDVVEKASRLQRKYGAMKAEAGLRADDAGGIKDINAIAEDEMDDADQVSQNSSFAGSSSLDNFSSDKEERDFSTTNLQVEGIDESDIVKTDGRYIYAVKNDRIQIIDVQNKIPEAAGQITPDLDEDTSRICEMYVADQVLTLIIQMEETQMEELQIKEEKDSGQNEGSREKDSGKEEPTEDILSEADDAVDQDVFSLNAVSVTKVLTYDITDPKKAVLLHTAEQDGWYQTSRKIGSCLYLFTNKSLYVTEDMLRRDAVKEEAVSEWLPCVNGRAVKADDIYLPYVKDQADAKDQTDRESARNLSGEMNGGFLMSSIDLSDNNKVLDTKLIINNHPKIYVTDKSVYLYETDYLNDTQKTKIARFELDQGMIRAIAAAAVKGWIEDTFAIHENGNYLQVLTSVTSAQPWENRVYVLDLNLEKAGKLTGLAEDEKIYSARFVGTVGYFVTYRNTDPLFTVDFSNPSEPKIVGELKVTGFSEYLHFWDQDHLLGIGFEADPEDGRVTGVKMSMFNISDPANVTEEAKVILKADSCEALYNYKSVLVSVRKNVIAFTTQDYDDGYQEDYCVFSYENGKFVSRLEHSLSKKGSFGGSEWRSVYVGDVLYLVNEKKTIAFDMKDQWKVIGKVKY